MIVCYKYPAPEFRTAPEEPKPKHRAGLDPEEVDWEAHKAFMRGEG